jgi:hypothetical protein
MGRLVQIQQFQYDEDLIIHDSAAKTASFKGEVGGSAKVIDFGVGEPYHKMRVILDVSAYDATTGDERYTVVAQFSSAADFSTTAPTVTYHSTLWEFGAKAALNTAGYANTLAPLTGERNRVIENIVDGLPYRYMRLYVTISGTSPSITCTARLTHDHKQF